MIPSVQTNINHNSTSLTRMKYVQNRYTNQYLLINVLLDKAAAYIHRVRERSKAFLAEHKHTAAVSMLG